MTENFCRMRDLFDLAQQNTHLSANAVLQQFVEQQVQSNVNSKLALNAPNAQMNMAPNANPSGFPQGPNQLRGFHMNGPANPLNHFATNGNLGLPGPGHPMNSPHMRGGSPGHPNMMPVATQMVAQHSQQGNSSSATASSNASPNAPSKKRRASAVKQEGGPDDPGGLQVNGMAPVGPPDGQGKTKSTPKLGGKRQKANS